MLTASATDEQCIGHRSKPAFLTFSGSSSPLHFTPNGFQVEIRIELAVFQVRKVGSPPLVFHIGRGIRRCHPRHE
jgi:hypothetical protein